MGVEGKIEKPVHEICIEKETQPPKTKVRNNFKETAETTQSLRIQRKDSIL